LALRSSKPGSAGNQGGFAISAWFFGFSVESLYEEHKATGAKIRHAPLNFPWAYEMKVEDHDGSVLRFGSLPEEDQPFNEQHN
jgi:hypothetical protein